MFNGTNIVGATNLTLNLANVQFSDSGTYSVVTTNIYGFSFSSSAILSVIPYGAPSIFVNGQVTLQTVSANAAAQITMLSGFPNGITFFTLDGSTPNYNSQIYSGPITLTNSTTIKAMSLSADFSQTAYAPAVALQIIPVYTLQTSVIGNGAITVSPTNSSYASNSVVALTATASQYWSFDHWAGDASGNQNPLSVTMNGPRNVQAVFVPTSYPLTASTPGGGSVTVNGQAIAPATYYPTGSVVTLSATASNGWSFMGWQGSAIGTNNPLNLTISQTNNIQAIFGTIVTTSPIGGGSIVLNQANLIPYGTLLTASAVANNGNYLVTWGGAASGTNTPASITVTNVTPTIGALFSALPGGKYSLIAVVNGNGSVTISPQQSYYNPGDNVTLTASTTNPGTSFYGWTGDATATNSSISVLMNASKVIQANFGALPSVTITPPALTILAGSNSLLTASASGLPPLSYQWENSLGAIADATNSTLAINNAQSTSADNYFVVVANPYGAVTSAVATVTVVFPPAITMQPVPQTVAAGTPVTLGVTATGTPLLYYQWANSLGPIPGATNASFSLNPAQTNNWDNYFVVITNAYGAATSAITPLVVYGPVGVISEPMSQVVPLGASAAFAVFATGFPPPVYQWTLNGTNLVGRTSNTLTVTNVGLKDAGYYQALINNGYSTNNSYLTPLNILPSLVTPFSSPLKNVGFSKNCGWNEYHELP